jgi:hypothetical protein
MNQRSDIDRLLTTWLDDGPTTMPDSVVDVVADRIGRTRQRRSWRLLRRLQMNTYVKLAAAAVIGVIAVGVIYLNLPGRTDVGGPSPTPSATASPLGAGALAGGRYRIPFSPSSSLAIVADIPAGWTGYPQNSAIVSPGSTSNDEAVIAFMNADGLHSDPCHWDLDGTGAYDQPGDVDVGPTVDDLVEALRANTSYTSSTPSPVTFGAFQGSELEIQLPGDDVLSTCDREPGGEPKGLYYVFSGEGAGWYSQGPDSRWQLFIVDVDGTRLIAMISYFEGTPQADVAAAQAIVESFEITP